MCDVTAKQQVTYFVGVDVGTGSARAALVTDTGKIVKVCSKPIQTWNPQPDYYEQSSDDIWNSCRICIKDVIEGCNPQLIKGIGFDATCSLVALDKHNKPLSVSPTGNNEQNVILWMDHRASKEAEKINSLNHAVLKYVGGKISLEMETPKLVWLKNNLKHDSFWNKVGLFFDLPDFLTWKATGGSESRSLCSLVCKWTYEIKENGVVGWNKTYFKEIGLEELLEEDCRKIGKTVLAPGEASGSGLSPEVAADLNLLAGTPVGTSIIDAHAGGLGLVGCSAKGISEDFESRLSLICGTSTCHMAVSPKPIFVHGVWGPYFSAMVPGMWLNEGGQSATGKLLDHVIETHPATSSVLQKIGKDMHIQQYLSNKISEMAEKLNLPCSSLLTKHLHIWPDFHGNRSPLADPNLKGMISGLSLANDEENLAIVYLATLQALSYGTRHIIETLQSSGYKRISSVSICGGLSKNALFVQTQADVLNLPVLCPEETESVLLGAAILGASAANRFADFKTALRAMGGTATVVRPSLLSNTYHNKKYRVFLKMVEHQKQYKRIMDELEVIV